MFKNGKLLCILVIFRSVIKSLGMNEVLWPTNILGQLVSYDHKLKEKNFLQKHHLDAFLEMMYLILSFRWGQEPLAPQCLQ